IARCREESGVCGRREEKITQRRPDRVGAGAVEETRREERIVRLRGKRGKSRAADGLLRAALGAGLIGAALCSTLAMAQEKRPTAREVVAAIQEHIGLPRMAKTAATFKASNPDTPGAGIGVTR